MDVVEDWVLVDIILVELGYENMELFLPNEYPTATAIAITAIASIISALFDMTHTLYIIAPGGI